MPDTNCGRGRLPEHRLHKILGQPRLIPKHPRQRFNFDEPGRAPNPYSRLLRLFSAQDQLILNGFPAGPHASQRVSDLLDRIRALAGIQAYALIESSNNFPTGTGIASSASGFSALALAGSRAAGLELSEAELSRLARTASGSACRSIPAGFVEWQAGEDDRSSFAFTIAPPDHWQLVDCIAIISQIHKPTTSQEGHALADPARLQAGRIASSTRRSRFAGLQS